MKKSSNYKKDISKNVEKLIEPQACKMRFFNPTSQPVYRVLIIIIHNSGVLIFLGGCGLIIMTPQVLTPTFFLYISPISMMYFVCNRRLFGMTLLEIQMRATNYFEHFGFLRTLAGRGFFNVYLSSQVFYQLAYGSNSRALGWAGGMIVLLLGIAYLGLSYCVESNSSQRRLKQQVV